jgi:hypothetical protein
MPDMSRLRRGKWRAWGAVPGGISESSTPRLVISPCRASFSGALRDVARQAAAVGRGVAGADHGDGPLPQQVAPAEHRDDRRGVLEGGQGRRVVRLDHGQQPRADRLQRRQLALGRLGRADPDRPGPAAAPRQIRQGPERRFGVAETGQKAAKGDRPHVLAADQAQPGEAFGGAEGVGLGSGHPATLGR